LEIQSPKLNARAKSLTMNSTATKRLCI
jgi:hypothetical protein